MISNNTLTARAANYLNTLCRTISTRQVGSAGNRAATDFFATTAATHNFTIRQTEFDCFDWRPEGTTLYAGGQPFTVQISPYSHGCQVEAPLIVITNEAELAAADLAGKLVLLRGEIAAEQLMPKSFSFYNPDHHQRIIALLEAGQPAAVVAATGRDTSMAGGLYPFPLFEDGDLTFPSVYMTDVEGERLAAYQGQTAVLHSRARRIPSVGYQVVAGKGADFSRRMVLLAHIDAKAGTPGAADNASGVVTLLLLAELLANYNGRLGLELVAINGEDYYANPGEHLFLAENEGRWDEIVLGVNIDGLGYAKSRVGYSFYNCSPELTAVIESVLTGRPELVTGEPWFAGDHALFMRQQRPALAFTSEPLAPLMEIIHTPQDSPEIIDPAQLAATAVALRDLVVALANSFSWPA